MTISPQDADSNRVSLRVLVVDDDVATANLFVLVLARAGHEARAAYDGLGALSVAESFRPDIAVLDLGLPGIDGLELGRRMRELPALRGIRLIALTGYGQESDRQRSANAGFEEHLVKPTDFRKLASVIARIQPAP